MLIFFDSTIKMARLSANINLLILTNQEMNNINLGKYKSKYLININNINSYLDDIFQAIGWTPPDSVPQL